MGDFQPGVARMAREGTAVVHQAYPLDPLLGGKVSIAEIARRIHDGRNDKDVRGWAGDVLIAAGRPKSTRSVAQAILNAFRKETIYAPDPIGTEMINSAAATLCLRPGLCVRARDCDDGVVAVGSALASLGYEIRVIKQTWTGQQEHVLLAVRDETDQWLPLDPAHDTSAVGHKTPADREEWTDPMMNASPVLVGVGALRRETHWDGRHWWERKGGQWMIYLGNRWRPVPGVSPASTSSGGVKWCTICWVNEYGEKQCTQVACGTSSYWGTVRAGLGATTGIRICTPDDVRNASVAQNALIESITNDLKNCPQISDALQAAWVQFRGVWFQWYSTNEASWLNRPCDRLDELDGFAKQTFAWQTQLNAVCKLSTPIAPPTPKPGLPTPNLNPDVTKTGDAVTKVLTAGAVFVGVAGALYALTLLGPSIRNALDAKPAKKH